MGYSQCTDAEIQGIGRCRAAKYRARHGKGPSKHKQCVKGNYVLVNSYVARDREQAVREVMMRGRE